MHTDECIAKVTDFITTLEIYRDPSWSLAANRYAIIIKEINKTTFKTVMTRHPDLTPAEAVFLFNKKASGCGFKVRVSVLMPRESVIRAW
jgi:hypothetical protein